MKSIASRTRNVVCQDMFVRSKEKKAAMVIEFGDLRRILDVKFFERSQDMS